MGTLYDLLGALPRDDAEALRTAFRKAAKTTHPDMNPDDPEAAVRFRKLVRAYDILNDVDQRATYDQLLAIALRPTAVTKSTRTYENLQKVASRTMAASIISAVLVGGYVLLGIFSKSPGAAEMLAADSEEIAAAARPEAAAQDVTRLARVEGISAGGTIATAAVAPAAKEASTTVVSRLEPVPAFATYNLAIQYYPRFAAAYFDRVVLYRLGAFDQPFADIPAVRRIPDAKRIKNAATSNATPANATPVPRKPMLIVPPAPPAPERRSPITAALTPG